MKTQSSLDWALWLCLIALLTACQQQPAGSGSNGSENAAEKDHIALVQPNGRLQLEKIDDILLEEHDDQVLSLPVDMAVGPRGGLYIADYRQNTIHHYDSSGRFVRRIGRFGDGPGEFSALQKMQLTRNSIFAYDVRPRRIHVFDLEGNYLRTFSTLIGADAFVGGQFDVSGDGRIIFLETTELAQSLDDLCETSFIVAVCDSNLRVVAKAGRHDPYFLDRCVTLGPERIIRADDQGRVYVLPLQLPRLTIYERDFHDLTRYSFRTTAWVFPQPVKTPTERFEQNSTSNKDLLIGHTTGRIHILSSFYDSDKRSVARCTLHVLAPSGELLFSDDIPIASRMPMIAIDADEHLYFFTDMTPEQVKIGKYRLREQR